MSDDPGGRAMERGAAGVEASARGAEGVTGAEATGLGAGRGARPLDAGTAEPARSGVPVR
jgi:hypothetical protein